MKDIDKNNKSFENIKHIDENDIEFWYARELMPVLQYSNWQNFERIINKAKMSCQNSDISILDHFIDVSKMVQIGSGAYREQIDYKLTRYACYLIAQNKDNIQTETEANKTHYNIGKNIREVIAKNGGTMPEELPTPKKSLKQLEKENKKMLDNRVENK